MTELEALGLIAERIDMTNHLIAGLNFFLGVILGAFLFFLMVRKW